MRKLFFVLVALFGSYMALEAQTVGEIRKLYADAKSYIANNGKGGMAPLDIKMTTRSRTMVSDDEGLSENTELTFYFTKYRIDSTLDYPDASSCYFVTDKWESDGHTTYRETLFDPNEGYLIFSFMRAVTHTGFEVETRYYYGADGRLIDEKYKVGGKEATANAQSWTTAEGDKEQAALYLAIFDALMNQKHKPTTKTVAAPQKKGDPKLMKQIRETYAKAKQKVENNSQAELPCDVQVVIRDQSWGPAMTTDLNFYYDDAPANGSRNCYLITKHYRTENMGQDVYSEYLFKPESRNLIFSYCKAIEENEPYEWRYYFDDNARCIETKTNADEQDNGTDDQQTAKRYLDLFEKICEATIP